jgi:very-short-patch-repair endonuclease
MNGWRALAQRQYGVITRVQLRTQGVTDRRIQVLAGREELERVHPGVFRVAGSFPSARQRAMAACLWCGDEALISHGSAAELLRLPVPAPKQLHVSVPASVRRTSAGVVLHRRDTLDRRDWFRVDGLPCTSAARTVIDLAATLDGEELEHALDAARRLGLLTLRSFARRVDELAARGRAGSGALRELVAVAGDRPKESRLEVRVARLLRQAGLRPEAVQHRVGRFRLDFAWLARRVAVECDGFEWHGSRLQWKRDRRRIAAIEAAGWRIVHVTWEDVTLRPAETIARIQAALAR